MSELKPCPFCGGEAVLHEMRSEGGGAMSAADELRRMLDEHGVEWVDTGDGSTLIPAQIATNVAWDVNTWPSGKDVGDCLWVQNRYPLTPEQAIAATMGRPKAKAHPYGYEPDTGAFDATRCECGCLNDISARYCNDCGGEIEIDMNAEKEIYHTPRHMVFAEKHDDGSLELGGKRYIAATLDVGTCETCPQMDNPDSFIRHLLGRETCERPSDEPPLDRLLNCLRNDYGIEASWDGLRRVWTTERAAPPFAVEREGEATRWHELFGTPERAAQTLQDMCDGAENCKDLRCPALQDTEAECGNYKLLLKWLRESENYIDGGESGPICPIPRANVIYEGQKLTFDDEDSAKFEELVKGHFRKLAGLGGDAE